MCYLTASATLPRVLTLPFTSLTFPHFHFFFQLLLPYSFLLLTLSLGFANLVHTTCLKITWGEPNASYSSRRLRGRRADRIGGIDFMCFLILGESSFCLQWICLHSTLLNVCQALLQCSFLYQTPWHNSGWKAECMREMKKSDLITGVLTSELVAVRSNTFASGMPVCVSLPLLLPVTGKPI